MTQMAPVTHDLATYVGGKRRGTDRTTGITDLATGETFEAASVTDQATAEAAVFSAEDALDAMGSATVPQRAAWCQDIADGIQQRRDELTDTLVREAGKPITSARAAVDQAAQRFDAVATELHELGGEYRTWTSAERTEFNAFVKAAPLGVTVCRPSADSPLGTAALQIAPALAAGNSVILQPAKTTPVAASMLTDIIAETDVPADGFAFLPEPTSDASKLLTTHDSVAAILQSGPSSAIGLTETPSGTVRLRMGLDGIVQAMVLDDADVADAADAIANGRLRNPGSRSPCTTPVLVHEAVHDSLVTRIDDHMADWVSGDLFDEETTVAPLIDHGHARRVSKLVTDALDGGAQVRRGGEANGRNFEPTLLTDVPVDAKIHQESRAPVIAVTPVESVAQAVSVVNERDQPTAPSVFTDSYDRAMALGDDIDTRYVRINGAASRGPRGRVLGATGSNNHGLHEMLACLTQRKRVVH